MELLRRRLPPGWSAQLVDLQDHEPAGEVTPVARINSPDGRFAELVVLAHKRLDPRRAQALVSEAKALTDGRAPLAIAPWLSAVTRSILSEGGVNLVDLTGGVRVVVAEPGLFVETASADRNPWPEDRRVTLRGDKAARVVLALCAARPPVGIRELAAKVGTTPGYVSKLVRMLDGQAAVQRTEGGQVGEIDLRRLLARWAEDAPLDQRVFSSSWIAPRGLTALMERPPSVDIRYALTGSMAASRRAPVAAPRVVSAYVDDPDAFARAVGLREADAGANVLLLVPNDPAVFDDTFTDQDLCFAALPRVVADLLTGPGRGPAEADALLDWMIENPEAWRG